MSDFMFPPAVVLETMEDVRAALLETTITSFNSSEKYRVKSVWLIALIDEIAASGSFPYNGDVERLAESRLGLPPRPNAETSNDADTLSTLIYNAQRYRRSDLLMAQGFRPFTDDLLRDAYETGKRLELLSSSILGEAHVSLNVRKIEGRLYAMRSNRRTHYVRPAGQPIRMVA